MKYTNCNILSTILITGTLAAVNTISASAQVVESVETAVTSEGTISELGEQMLIVKSATATEGVRYTSSETTTYVDEEGQPVSVTTVKSGLPVTVYYTKVGDSLVASKVIVRKVATGPAGVPGAVETATMSAGTISEFGTDRIIIRTAPAANPLRYAYSKTTTYVDEAGQPVSIKTVKSGLPVTVYYTKVGDSMVATKVIVRKAAVVKVAPPVPTPPPVPTIPVPAPIIETKKTTTTTRTVK